MARGKTIKLYIGNGNSDDIVEATLSNWNGKAFKIPRIEVASCDEEEISCPGVYFLFGKEYKEDSEFVSETEYVYIGEADDVKDRLIQHINKYPSKHEQFYWNTAVILVGADLDKAIIQYLERQFVKIAQSCGRFRVITKRTNRVSLDKSEIDTAEEFADNTKMVINALGYKIFEPLYCRKNDDAGVEDVSCVTFYLDAYGAKAKGVVTTEGFFVFKGAIINTDAQEIMPPGTKILRRKILSCMVENSVTKEGILFLSPVVAASVLIGDFDFRHDAWKTKDGRLLKDFGV